MTESGSSMTGSEPSRLRWIGFTSALILALGLITLVLMVEVSSQPGFCGTCHVMAPYYESWVDSSHAEVACVECHIPPGVAHEVRKKWEALSMVASYFTGTYGTNPWTEIDDSACLRCHQRRLLAGQEVFGDVLFDHGPHLADLRRGKKLRCTSCHSQIVQGTHIAVTSSTCILCHFKDQESDGRTTRCLLCHDVPETIVTKGLVEFNHGDVRRFDMDCRWCHTSESISNRGGEVPRERCVTCHNDPSRVAEYEDTELLHRMHVAEHKVDCLHCHLEIRHGGEPGFEPAQTECRSCHKGGHSLHRDLYAGVGGRGVEPMPAPMYSAGVACEGCHIQIPGHEREIAVASDVACMSCHGPGYRPVLKRWEKSVEERVQPIRQQLQATAALFRGTEPQPLKDARHNVELVEEGRGIHNTRYAFALLAKAHEFLNSARAEAARDPLPLPWPNAPYESPCLQCHQGIESHQGSAFGLSFSHDRHVVAQQIECRQCHRAHKEKAKGEVLRFGRAGCISCHHKNEEADCLSCHSAALEKEVRSFKGPFRHGVHLEMGADCQSCHKLRVGQVPVLDRSFCTACHEQ